MNKKIQELIEDYNDLVDCRNICAADAYDKGEMYGIKETIRACGYRIERDDKGHIIALHVA